MSRMILIQAVLLFLMNERKLNLRGLRYRGIDSLIIRTFLLSIILFNTIVNDINCCAITFLQSIHIPPLVVEALEGPDLGRLAPPIG